MNPILSFAVNVAALALIVLAATEALGRLTGHKAFLSLVLGVAGGLSAYGAGFLPVPDPGWHGLFGWIFAGFSGLGCTFLAKIMNDHGVNRIAPSRKENP